MQRSISEAARELGISVHTLRYYERARLLPPVTRETSSTHRRYGDQDIAWLNFVLALRSTGMPIATIERYGRLALQGDETAPERRQILEDHRTGVAAQLEQISAHLQAISTKVRHYEQMERGLSGLASRMKGTST